MAVYLRKLARIGKLPEELRAEVEAEGIVHLAEYVAVTRRFSGAIPGHRASGSIASYAGALALTHERVLATLSTMPKLAGRTIDQAWTTPQGGAATADLSATGLQLDVDLAGVEQHWQGHLSLHYKVAIPDAVLARLPLRTLTFEMPPEYVFRAVGVPYHP